MQQHSDGRVAAFRTPEKRGFCGNGRRGCALNDGLVLYLRNM